MCILDATGTPLSRSAIAALARGLSDLAAMGARPVAAFLSLALPRELTIPRHGQPGWVDRFFDGLLALADQAQVPLAGGDTAESPRIATKLGDTALVAADIMLIGGVKRGRALLRSGAQAGDLIYVTGPGLGGSAAQLLALERNPQRFAALEDPPLPDIPTSTPTPASKSAASSPSESWPPPASTSATDSPPTSATSAKNPASPPRLTLDAIPIHPMAQLAEAAGWTPSALDLALHGGEDYELLFTAPPRTKIPKSIAGIAIHSIGQMSKRQRGPRS